MRWTPADYVADTLHLTPEADLLYRRLIDLIWLQDGAVPDDEIWLRSRLRVPDSWFAAAWPEVAELVDIEDGVITQARVVREIEAATGRYERSRKGGIARSAAQAEVKQKLTSATQTQTQTKDLDERAREAGALLEGARPSTAWEKRFVAGMKKKNLATLTDAQMEKLRGIEQHVDREHVSKDGTEGW